MTIGFGGVGPVMVKTTNNRGFTPDEIAEMAMDRIMHVADTAPAELRSQALAFRERLHTVVALALKQAVRSDRTTLAAKLKEAGQHEAAHIIGKL